MWLYKDEGIGERRWIHFLWQTCVCVRVRVRVCVFCRPDNARVHPGLHVQPGGGGEDHCSAEPRQPHQQPGVHPGICGQPA